MSRPLIALLTDFGTLDHYVGTMKGVMLGICPEATLVDITHDVPPHDVRIAARQLAAACRYFPAGTVFLVVVDPGVGSSRRGLAVDTGDYRFVAPDNGVLGAVLDELPPRRIVELTERKFALPTVSRTFEGRDRFAPAAAWLARGAAITTLGRGVTAPVRLDWPSPTERPDGVDGEVELVDRFGNLVTNIGRAAVERLLRGGGIDIAAGGHAVAHLVDTYADVPAGAVCALFGSSDRLEIAVSGGSAAAHLALGTGAAVQLRRAAL
ncbi:MAG: S-adenosyl-l-methionine hydroxide adenosyltransferase family protein [Vicinamibacterales bacterium]